MRQPLFGVTGDNHLRLLLQSKDREMTKDAYEGFRQVVSACLKFNIPLLLVGDVVDKAYPDDLTIRVLVSEITRMQEARLRVYYINGNHDRPSVGVQRMIGGLANDGAGWPSVSPWSTHVHRVRFQIGPYWFYGFDGVSPDRLLAELTLVPEGTDFLLTHQGWKEIQPAGTADGSLSMLPPHVTRVISGHIHVHGAYRSTNSAGLPVVAYSPGSTCLHRMDEPPVKCFYICYQTDETPEGHVFEKWPIATRPFAHWELDTAEHLDAVVNMLQTDTPFWAGGLSLLPEPLRKPCVRIKYRDTLPNAYKRIKAAAGDRYHLFLEPVVAGAELVVDFEQRPSAFESLRSAITELTPDDVQVRGGLFRLLESPNPAVELDAMFKEYQAIYGQEANNPGGLPAGQVG